MRSRVKLISFQLLLLFFLLAAVEIGLRRMGYSPGDMRPNWINFHPVDSLYVIPSFYVNHDGILVADSALLAAEHCVINHDGFRSPDFNKIDSTKKKILFIGDSFTWGLSAMPVTDHCFVDLVRNETSFEVINLGIPATDPPQYEALAAKYIPRFKPAITFVVFFMGNDLLTEDRKVIPDEPFYYYTNAGAISADIDGIHFKSAAAAYNYGMNERYFLHHPKNVFEWVISKSALLSRLYSVKYRIKEKMEYEAVVKDSRVTKKYLKQIQQIAAQNNVPVKFLLVPEYKDADKALDSYVEKYRDILLDKDLKSDWLMLPNSKANFNNYPDGHLNNKGHRYYADFLKNYLEQFFEEKSSR
jgi:hypothetical protein